MILKLKYQGTTNVIEAKEFLHTLKRLKSKEEAEKWSEKIGNHFHFGQDVYSSEKKDLHLPIIGHHIRYEKTRDNWIHILAFECAIYLMNENGKTIDVF